MKTCAPLQSRRQDRARVLLVDDDPSFRLAMAKTLQQVCFATIEASNGAQALALLQQHDDIAAVLVDLHMDGLSGLDVLRQRRQNWVPFIIITGNGSIGIAVQAMRLGAFSVLEKPVDKEVLQRVLRQALGTVQQQSVDVSLPALVGHSAAMREVKEFIARVGPTDETVTIAGETGTGKEVVARHLHHASLRRTHPFVAFNAACVPHDLFESELFGHKRGAFTGATHDRAGLFVEAQGGTLFIDEVGELPLESQAKLLRALESKTIRPIGANREVLVDVRIVVATNRDLWQGVQSGQIREDLYFRLQVFPLRLSPLRERRADLQPLAETLLRRIPEAPHLGAGVETVLHAYDWPGNVRELLNVLRRGALFTKDSCLDAQLLQRMIDASMFAAPQPSVPRWRHVDAEPVSGTSTLAAIESAHIAYVLRQLDGNVTQAANALGIDRRTLQRKLKSYDIAAAGHSVATSKGK